MSVFENYAKADAVYADLYYVKQNNTNKIVRTWISGKQKKFADGWHPGHPTFYVKKNIYEKYGLFDLSFKIAAYFEIMLRFLEKYKIPAVYLPQPLIEMRLGGESNKSLKNILNGNKENMRAFTENGISVSKAYTVKRWKNKILQYFKS